MSIRQKFFSLTIVLLSFIGLWSCQANQKATIENSLIIHNGEFYSPDADLKGVKAIAINNGKISAIYTDDTWRNDKKNQSTELLDANGGFVLPGLIEGHGHFYGLGSGLQSLNFSADTTWQAIVSKTAQKVAKTPPGQWIYGRGWHQEKWNQAPEQSFAGYPTHNSLSDASPDNPLLLMHASGHSLFANAAAMDLVGVQKETPDPVGGKIIKDSNGNPTGVFEENAMQVFIDAFDNYKSSLPQELKDSLWLDAIHLAEHEAISNGITSFQDAGSKYYEIEAYHDLAQAGGLRIRLSAMLREKVDNLKEDLSRYKIISAGDGHFTCQSIKSELDGALGAHGAWLLQPYSDKPEFYGQNTTTVEAVAAIAKIAKQNGMQLCVHAIGDKANQEVINIFETYMADEPNLRWRIEHAQHLDTTDITRLAKLNILAAMQAIHCTSDAPFVEKRLGEERAKYGAYAWRSVLDAGGIIVNGTDTPVEDINPLHSLYSSVTRQYPGREGPAFYPEQSMTRAEAIRSYTLDAAYGAFEEEIKGSLTLGKYGDVTILDTNIMTCSDAELLDANVLFTIINGKVEYRSK